jgi:hypothetical protein
LVRKKARRRSEAGRKSARTPRRRTDQLRLPDGDRASWQREATTFLQGLGKAAQRLEAPSGEPQELVAGLSAAGCDEQDLIALLAAATSTYRNDFQDRRRSRGIRYHDLITTLVSGRLSRGHIERLPKRFKKQLADAEGMTIDDLSKALPAVELTGPLGKRASLHAAVERTVVRWVLARTESKRGCKTKARRLLHFATELATPRSPWISFEPRAFDLRIAGGLVLNPQTLADLGAAFLRSYESEG